MTKANLFTLFITVIVVVIVAEFVVNDYMNGSAVSLVGSANVLDETVGAAYLLGDMSSGSAESGNQINFDVEGLQAPVFNIGSEELKGGDTAVAVIDFIKIGEAGFGNVTMQRVPFNGILFEKVDMRDFKSVPIIQNNLLQYNRKKVAEFYELHTKSVLLGNEIYLLIKEKAQADTEAGVNITNEYLDGSYYINYKTRPDTAFLVVKHGESVYILSYKKELHSFVETLITLL